MPDLRSSLCKLQVSVEVDLEHELECERTNTVSDSLRHERLMCQKVAVLKDSKNLPLEASKASLWSFAADANPLC